MAEREMSNTEKRELRDLYGRLATVRGYPMPQSWDDDVPAIKADPFGALSTLRVLVAQQCPEEVVREAA